MHQAANLKHIESETIISTSNKTCKIKFLPNLTSMSVRKITLFIIHSILSYNVNYNNQSEFVSKLLPIWLKKLKSEINNELLSQALSLTLNKWVNLQLSLQAQPQNSLLANSENSITDYLNHVENFLKFIKTQKNTSKTIQILHYIFIHPVSDMSHYEQKLYSITKGKISHLYKSQLACNHNIFTNIKVEQNTFLSIKNIASSKTFIAISCLFSGFASGYLLNSINSCHSFIL